MFRDAPHQRCGGEIVFAALRSQMKEANPPGAGQQQTQRMIRHFRDAIIRAIRDGDAQLGGGVDGDVVEADAQPGHDPALRAAANHGVGDVGPIRGDGIRGGGQANQRGFVGGRGFHQFGISFPEHVSFNVRIRPSPVRQQHLKARHRATNAERSGMSMNTPERRASAPCFGVAHWRRLHQGPYGPRSGKLIFDP